MTRFDHETARWMPSRATAAGPSELSPMRERRDAVRGRSVRQAATWLWNARSGPGKRQKAPPRTKRPRFAVHPSDPTLPQTQTRLPVKPPVADHRHPVFRSRRPRRPRMVSARGRAGVPAMKKRMHHPVREGAFRRGERSMEGPCGQANYSQQTIVLQCFETSSPLNGAFAPGHLSPASDHGSRIRSVGFHEPDV